MQHTVSSTSHLQSRRSPLVLLLVALFVVLAVTQGMAQTPAASTAPQTLQAPASTADFLATLSAGGSSERSDAQPCLRFRVHEQLPVPEGAVVLSGLRLRGV